MMDALTAMKQALQALIAMQMEATARNHGLKMCDEAIENLTAAIEEMKSVGDFKTLCQYYENQNEEQAALLNKVIAERDALANDKANFCMQYRMDCDEETKELEDEIARLKVKCNPVRDYERSNLLAASQAREARLREALLDEDASHKHGVISASAHAALNMPYDDAALNERLAAERERCINCYSPDDTAIDWADKIRRLT